MSADFGCQCYQSALLCLVDLAKPRDSPETGYVAQYGDRRQSAVSSRPFPWLPERRGELQAHFGLAW